MKRLKNILSILLLPAVLTGCTLYEEPELNNDGTVGVDPTQVTVNFALNMTQDEPATRANTRVPVSENYLQRFTVVAYLNRQEVARQVVYEDITDRSQISVPVSMKLNAREYQIAVWADYVEAEARTDLFYDTSDMVPVIPFGTTYHANSEYKDVHYACHSLNLSGYRDEWGAEVLDTLTLQRPVARYEVIATDLQAFKKKIASGEIEDGTFIARIKYNGYLSTGFNVLDGITKNAMQYIQYQMRLTLPEEEDATELRLGIDYLFLDNDETANIPIEIEIVNDDNDETVARTTASIPVQRNRSTIVRLPVLSVGTAGGVGVNDEYDGSIDIDLGEIEVK